MLNKLMQKLKRNKNLAGVIALSVLLFGLGAGIGRWIQILEAKSLVKTHSENKAFAMEENFEIEVDRKRVAYQDEINSKKVIQISESSGELFLGVKDLAEAISADVQWNNVNSQFMIKKEDRYIVLDTEKSIVIGPDESRDSIRLYGSGKKALVPAGKIAAYFDYRISKLDEIDIFRIKNAQSELLDIELSNLHKEDFNVDISDYDIKYKREKAILEEEYPEKRKPVIMKEIPDEKTVYLTFDDGPNENTLKLLNIMRSYNIKGTFFVLGENISGKENILDKTSREGHALGLHSMNHKFGDVYESPESFISQMDKNNELVKSVTGYKSKLVRPPYGSKPHLNKEFRDLAVGKGYRIWDWNVDSKDAADNSSAKEIYDSIVKQAEKMEGPVVLLFHDKPETVRALPDVIDYFLKRGYRFDTISEDLLPLNFWEDKRVK